MSMQQASAVDSVLVEQLREILGPGLGRRRLEQLLTQAYGSVQRAVDLHFSAASDSVGAQVPGSSTARATAEPSNSVGPSSAFQAVAPARHPRTSSGRRTTSSGFRSRADFVELSSSSTDNEFDPGTPWEPLVKLTTLPVKFSISRPLLCDSCPQQYKQQRR